MRLARVVGTVVSTINAPIFEDRTLLLCDLVDPAGAPAGGYMIAVDTVGAGPGETVLLIDEGSSARQILGVAKGPVRTLVVGIVDAVSVEPDAVRAARDGAAGGVGDPAGTAGIAGTGGAAGPRGAAAGADAPAARRRGAKPATSAARPASQTAGRRSGRARRSNGTSASS